jgi:hypothetical protein
MGDLDPGSSVDYAVQPMAAAEFWADFSSVSWPVRGLPDEESYGEMNPVMNSSTSGVTNAPGNPAGKLVAGGSCLLGLALADTMVAGGTC